MVNYPAYMAAANISRRQMINTIKQVFPKYEKPTETMVCNSADYGCQLTPEAEKLLISAFGWHEGLAAKKPKVKENRCKSNRLYVRLDDVLFDRVKALAERMQFVSMQDLIEASLSDFVNKYGGGQ